jgi:ribosomal protein L22
MPRIKIKDLPKDMKMSKEIMKKIRGGTTIRATDSLSRVKKGILLNRETIVGITGSDDWR